MVADHKPRHTIVVTGISSFVGCHLAKRFALEGHRVIGTTSRGAEGHEGVQADRLKSIPRDIELERLNLADCVGITRLVDRLCPDFWLHHGGYAAGYDSLDYDLRKGLETNVLGLDWVYKALRNSQCCIIITGSSAEYASATVANSETDTCLPATPYGLAKYVETLRAQQLTDRYGVRTRVARLYIPFGDMDHPRKVVPMVLQAMRSNVPIKLSPCTQVRDMIGIADVCNGYVALIGDMPRAQFDIFNISSGVPTSVREFLLLIAAKLGADDGLLRFGEIPMRDREALVSFGANEKARRLLRWSASRLDEAIDRDLLGHSVRPVLTAP